MLTHQEVDDYIVHIRTAIDRLAGADGGLSQCFEVEMRLQELRTQYKQNPRTLAGRVEELSGLSKRFDDVLTRRLPQVVDRYYAVNEEMRRAETEKDFWREVLIRKSLAARADHVVGTLAAARIRSIQCRRLPPANSGDRKQLEDLISQSGHWESVSQVSRAKLERALEQNRFSPSLIEAIDRLCPVTEAHQVSVKAIGQ